MFVLGFAKSLSSLEVLRSFFLVVARCMESVFYIVFRLCWALVLGLFLVMKQFLGIFDIVDVLIGVQSRFGYVRKGGFDC